jgi:predicted HD phosphohydrolase
MVMADNEAPSWQTAYQQVTGSFDKAARIRYGESGVTELEHALQSAELADHAGADDELVFAAMLHDVGRYAVPQELVSDTLQDVEIADNALGHGERGAQLMANMLPARSLFCIRYHAESKLYLCQTNPNYRAKLAGASVKTLAVQSTDYDQARLDELSAHRWWQDAIRVRVWDDAAKVRGRVTRPLHYWTGRLEIFLDEMHPG